MEGNERYIPIEIVEEVLSEDVKQSRKSNEINEEVDAFASANINESFITWSLIEPEMETERVTTEGVSNKQAHILNSLTSMEITKFKNISDLSKSPVLSFKIHCVIILRIFVTS